MSTEYSPFARPTFSAADFDRDAPSINTRDEQPLRAEAPRSSTVQASNEPGRAQAQPVFAGTPIYAGSTKAKTAGRSIRPALMMGVPAVVLAAGVAYFAMQPRQTILADPVPATAAVEPLTTMPAAPAPTELAAVEAPPPAMTPPAAARAARTEAPARVARARPAPQADDASSFAADASATSPAAPIPYSALGQTSAPAPAVIVVPPVTTPPAETAPVEALTTPEPAVQDQAPPPVEAPDLPTP